jgi:hypothetical protein
VEPHHIGGGVEAVDRVEGIRQRATFFTAPPRRVADGVYLFFDLISFERDGRATLRTIPRPGRGVLTEKRVKAANSAQLPGLRPICRLTDGTCETTGSRRFSSTGKRDPNNFAPATEAVLSPLTAIASRAT